MGRSLSARTAPLTVGPRRKPGLFNRVLRGAAALATVAGMGVVASLGAGLAATQAGASASSQKIYVGNRTTGTVNAFALPAKGNTAPTVMLKASEEPLQQAFDANGNQWVANTKSPNTLTEFTATQVAKGATAPAVTIGGTGAAGVAVSSSGDVWIANWGNSFLAMYTPTQLTTSGTPTPKVVITSDTTTSLTGPENLAFDANGNLWVTDSHTDSVVEYAATQLKASGNPTPKVTIGSAGDLSYPTGLSFTSTGSLWVTGTAATAVAAEYTAAQLATSGSPTPAKTLTLPGAAWSNGIDATGNLWVALNTFTAGPSMVVGFTPAQQAAGGTVTPAFVLEGTTTTLEGLGGIGIKAPPTVTSVTPTAGPASGGNTVTVNGTGFTSATKVAFGASAGSTVNVVSPFKLTVKAPPGGGTVNVTATTFAGTSATSTADQYTYTSTGYRLVASDGGIFSFGTAPFHGSMGGKPLNAPVVGMASDLATGGYWMVATDGGIFSFTAPFFGSMGGKPLNAPIVAMAALPTGKGYWLVAADGGVFSFGTATFKGSMGGKPLNKPIVGMAAQPTGGGYWMVASDGGIFSFGTATFHGSMGGKPLNQPIVAMTPAPTGKGYWLVAADGGIFAFTVPFLGSMGGKPLNKPIVGMTTPATGSGYWMVASDGGIFSFTVPFFGSMGGRPLNKPIVGMSAA
jgi:IPT/TIG domain